VRLARTAARQAQGSSTAYAKLEGLEDVSDSTLEQQNAAVLSQVSLMIYMTAHVLP
jgi:hypothetical protein